MEEIAKQTEEETGMDRAILPLPEMRFDYIENMLQRDSHQTQGKQGEG
ncbi:MAG: hypothetical protein ACLTUL_20345 [Blautia faecis]